ncbi:MAG: gamma-glutamyl-gamma-aminobutyrate hydrolase family protein [Anaerolineae bacterium]|nr:gamma-glutamyl-gamma-aminobutyrate hydrolase family protein [Anaerolineae bacterium]
MRPRIGITVVRNDPDHVPNYLAALDRAGAEWQIITPATPDALAATLKTLDGLLLPGGGDIDPAYYGEALEGSETRWMDRVRDDLELTITRLAVEQDMPVLGICRGIQVLNVAYGGSLVQHIGHHRVGGVGPVWAQHKVALRPGSRLSEILGSREQVVVNSRHHQAVSPDRLAPGLVASAVTLPDDGIIEGVEAVGQTWVVGVQWHPERTDEVPAEHAALFDAFLDAARRYRGH